MKIRGSYGSLGNQVMDDLGNFPYLATYGTNSSYNYLINGSKPVIVKAPGLVAPDFGKQSLKWTSVLMLHF